ncbi:MAG: hypothetical protein H6835_19700 [Planctomycetes bacterium]|nr:hypothetical protein [Planctomycetota bacterium]
MRPIETCAFNGGADRVPPLPADDAPLKLDWSYDSSSAATSASAGLFGVPVAEQLYYQQRAGEARSRDFAFRLTEAANVHFQIGYDFGRGDVVLKLTDAAETDAVRYGVNRPGRNVLTANGLPAGSYKLTLYEPLAPLRDTLGCAAFWFYAETARANAAVSNRALQLPPSLDSVAYLGGSPELYLQGRFEQQGEAAEVRVHVAVQSVLRVQLEDGWQFVNTQLAQRHRQRNARRTQASSYVVAAGDYTLTFANSAAWFFASSLDVGIAVRPMSRVAIENADPAHFHSVCPTCANDASRCLAQPVANAQGFYQRRYDALFVDAAALTSSTTTLVANTTFVVARRSVFYARLGFDALLYPLYAELASASGAARFSGYDGHNYNELNDVVDAGTYRFAVYLKTPLNGTQALRGVAPACAQYDLSLVVAHAEHVRNHADCSALKTLPPSLNDFGVRDAAGVPAAVEYGVPLSATTGRLWLSADDFYMSGGEVTGADAIAVALARPQTIAAQRGPGRPRSSAPRQRQRLAAAAAAAAATTSPMAAAAGISAAPPANRQFLPDADYYSRGWRRRYPNYCGHLTAAAPPPLLPLLLLLLLLPLHRASHARNCGA